MMRGATAKGHVRRLGAIAGAIALAWLSYPALAGAAPSTLTSEQVCSLPPPEVECDPVLHLTLAAPLSDTAPHTANASGTAATGFTFTDSAGITVSTTDCVPVDPNTAHCMPLTLQVGGVFIDGGAGADRLSLGPLEGVGRELDGHRAADTLIGSNGQGGADRLFGSRGNDTIRAGEGNDFLAGGTGADRLFGGPHGDYHFGNQGIDSIFARDGSRDVVLNCGRGDNRLERVRRDRNDPRPVSC
jgi:hypothetical protein